MDIISEDDFDNEKKKLRNAKNSILQESVDLMNEAITMLGRAILSFMELFVEVKNKILKWLAKLNRANSGLQ
ncbi:hypothetical protein M9H77_02158 [Catharanthus roseus]|uniref:Uncharacterized protein n=1 Tax=Catharanthus roseus TaxID=4058 RepID=A0ACC0C7N9_CATRO|nr:hypothetical protein M9H77_02158 [Catharanthus roseus]